MTASKPTMSYKRRMESTDALWVIWSNKWGCWYKDKSQGYTSDPLRAGLFSREEALTHYEPFAPRKHRDTEPFPISALRAQATDLVAQAKANVYAAEQRLALICKRGITARAHVNTLNLENARG